MQEEHDAERARQAARAALEAGRVQRAEQQAQDAERERAAAEARRMETEARRAEAETRAAAAEREAAALRVDLQRAVAAGAECAGDVDLLASESVRMAGELAQRSTVEADLRRELFHAVAELARAREALSSGDSRSLPQVHRSEPESEAASLSDGKSPPPARTLMFASMHSGPDAAVATAVVANKGDSQSPVDALAGSVLPSPPSPKQLSLPRLEEDLPGPAARTALRSGPHSSINIGENSGGGGDSRGGGGGDQSVFQTPGSGIAGHELVLASHDRAGGASAPSKGTAIGDIGGAASPVPSGTWQGEVLERSARKRSILIGLSRQWTRPQP